MYRVNYTLLETFHNVHATPRSQHVAHPRIHPHALQKKLLRHTSNARRYYDEVRMHAAMGLNLIRVWGGGLAERPEFYDAADELGVFVMQEFWMSGERA